MTNIAILGFGVVGSGVADLITNNYAEVKKFGGIAYPAHIDRDANGIVAILGAIPEDTGYKLFELNEKDKAAEFSSVYGIPKENFIISSDAHSLDMMRDKENSFLLPEGDADEVRTALFKMLRKKAFGG